MDYKLINEYRQQGLTLKEIMAKMDIPCDSAKDYSRFRKRVQRNAPKYLLKAGTFKGHVPYASSVMVDDQGEVKLAWIKSSATDKLLSDLMDEIHKLKPSRINYTESEVPKTLLEIPPFDMHWGINTYEDYKPHLMHMTRLIRLTHDAIVITVGSDLFHHNDMRANTASGTPIEQLDIRKAFKECLQWHTELITEAIENSKYITVKYIKGNHDESLSWAFVQTLKQIFPMVTFDDEFKERKAFTWEGIFIGYIHGDKPINDIDRVFTREYRKELANAEIVEIHIGHTHKENAKGNTQDKQGVMVRVLSTSAKTDQWHDDNGYIGANKRFQLFEYGPDRLNAIYYV